MGLSICEVDVAGHRSKKSNPLPQLPDIEKIEGEIKSQFYKLLDREIWSPREIKR